MEFSEILAALRAGDGASVTVGAEWAQGRALFGGLAAALVLDPMQARVPPDRLPRSLAVNFVAPVAPGPVAIASRVLRAGGSVTHCQAEALQDGEVRTAAMASFGLPRDSAAVMDAEPPPPVPAPEEIASLPYREGVSPRFTAFFDYRYCIGALPFAGAASREMGGWIRFRSDRAPVTVPELLALVDAWPPATLPLLSEPAPSSSLSWFLELVHPLPRVAPGDWLLYSATLDHARDGYGQTRARLWTRAGELLAVSRQTVTVFG